ncbi:uncharacterized protein LOC124955267 [Vespa velutina]|uniref:uncharacterized protein LOC124955267 n=1 Tax=Vespa velutina TaxID=202808 RepID=UPI001FB3D3A1|nr:uncharacterized protein LOC124955267 [Vespa velutina]
MDSTFTVISGRGRDTYATAVSGGGRAGHPPSSTSNCQELGVGNLAPALDTASGRAPQVGDLACGVSNAPGRVEREGRVVREESHSEEWERATRAVERMQRSGSTSPIPVRTYKYARSPTYSSEEQELRVDLAGSNKQGPAKTPESVLDTGRLLEHIRNIIQGAENARRRFIKTEDDASRRMKHCNNVILEMIEVLRERLQIKADDPPSIKETIAQLKTEIKAKDLRMRELTEEVARFKKENSKIPLNPLAARSQTTTRGTVAPDPCRGPSALVSTSDRHTRDSNLMSIQELVESVGILKKTICAMQQQQETTGADGPYEDPILRAESSTRSLAEQEGVNDSQPLQEQAAPRKRGKRRKREREVAEISVFCTEQTMYRETLYRASTKINIKDMGINGMKCRRGLTGAFIWQVRGKGANEKADWLAEAFRNVIPEARITRPMRTRAIRLVGLDPAADETSIRNALLKLRSGTDPNLIKVGEIRIGRSRAAEVTVSAPVSVIRAALEKGRIKMGLTLVRVHELRQPPLRCHRCLAQGHVAVMCPDTKSRTDLCYVCGKPGHLGKTCTDKPACPVCIDAGRKPTNHRAGSWECPVVPPKKWDRGRRSDASTAGVIHSVLLYGTPVCWRAVMEDMRIGRAVRSSPEEGGDPGVLCLWNGLLPRGYDDCGDYSSRSSGTPAGGGVCGC